MRLDCGQQDKNNFRSVNPTLPCPDFPHFSPEKTITVAKPFPHLFPNNPPYFHPFTSTGKERDEETGYSYFGARYYDPEISGLFLSVDPMAEKYPSISPYVYCALNPVKLVDPNGDSCRFADEDARETFNTVYNQIVNKLSSFKKKEGMEYETLSRMVLSRNLSSTQEIILIENPHNEHNE